MSDKVFIGAANKLTPKEIEIVEQMTAHAIKLRGTFIHHVTYLERIIAGIIGYYFCEKTEKRIELGYSLINTRLMPFSTKLELLRFVMSNAHSDFKENNPELLDHILEIEKYRNMFAHQEIFTLKEGIHKYTGDSITFVNFKTEKQKTIMKKTEMSNKTFEQTLKKIEKACNKLLELQVLIMGRQNVK